MRVADIRQKKIDRLVEGIAKIQEQLRPLVEGMFAVVDAQRVRTVPSDEEEWKECEMLDNLEGAAIQLQHAVDYLMGEVEDDTYEEYYTCE